MKTTHVKSLAGILIGLYIGVCAGAWLIQDKLLYHPYTQPADLAYAQRDVPAIEEVSYDNPAGGHSYAWLVKPGKQKKMVVFLHGNSCNIGCFIPWVEPFVSAGYGVFMIEYQGFGGLRGRLGQKTFEQDALAGMAYLKRLGYQNKDIIIYGYSLGTYLATFTAYTLGQEEPFDAVILEAPFTTLTDVAAVRVKNLLPVKWLMRDSYPSIRYISDVNTRLFIAHGKRDTTVPYELGMTLFQTAKDPKMFFSSETATHTDLKRHGFTDAVLEWLSAR